MATPPVGQRIPFAQSSSGGHLVPLPDNLVARDRPGQRDVSPTPGLPGHSPVQGYRVTAEKMAFSQNVQLLGLMKV